MFDPTSNQYLVKAADRFFITTKTLTPLKGGTQHWPILWWFYWTSVCDFIWLIFFFCPSISLWAFNELTNFWKSHSTWSKKMDVRSTHDVQLFDQKFHISFNLVPAWSKTMKDNMANCFGLIIALSSLKGYGDSNILFDVVLGMGSKLYPIDSQIRRPLYKLSALQIS